MGTGSFPGVKRSGRGADNPTLSSTDDGNGLELHRRLGPVHARVRHGVTFSFTKPNRIAGIYSRCGRFVQDAEEDFKVESKSPCQNPQDWGIL
jgi:hypothetical protein